MQDASTEKRQTKRMTNAHQPIHMGHGVDGGKDVGSVLRGALVEVCFELRHAHDEQGKDEGFKAVVMGINIIHPREPQLHPGDNSEGGHQGCPV